MPFTRTHKSQGQFLPVSSPSMEGQRGKRYDGEYTRGVWGVQRRGPNPEGRLPEESDT